MRTSRSLFVERCMFVAAAAVIGLALAGARRRRE